MRHADPVIACRAAVALIDADHRVLIVRDAHTEWDMPQIGAQVGDEIAGLLLDHLQQHWHVTTKREAFFPLSFVQAEAGPPYLLYGCRNWVGANGLQLIDVQATTEQQWLRAARLHAIPDLAPALRAMLPVLEAMVG